MSPDTIVPGAANPQAWNRYSYVLGNPLRYTDPTGHGQCQTQEDCDDMGTTPMGTGGSGGGSPGNNGGNGGGGGNPHDDDDYDPNPNGLPAPGCSTGELICYLADELDCDSYSAYSPCSAGWHYYSNADNPSLVCPAIYHCTNEQMMDYLSRFAFPGQNPLNPVVDNGNYSVTIPGTNISMWIFGAITVDVDDSGLSSTNIGAPTHIFYDGKVTRTVSQASDGAWNVTTTGVGNNVWPFMNTLNQATGLDIFNNLDQQMYEYIVSQH